MTTRDPRSLKIAHFVSAVKVVVWSLIAVALVFLIKAGQLVLRLAELGQIHQVTSSADISVVNTLLLIVAVVLLFALVILLYGFLSILFGRGK